MNRLGTVAFIGDEFLMLQCASMARDTGADVAMVASRNAELMDRAARDGFHVIDSSEVDEFLASHDVGVLFSIANEFVMAESVLAAVDVAINFHDGPLPDYKGLGVTTWALFRGETQHGVTWHTMTAEVDGGEVVLASTFELADDETAFSLNARCYEEALATFPAVLDRLWIEPRQFSPQDDRQGRWFGRYQRPVVLFDPTNAADDLDRAVRSVDLGPRIRNRLGSVRLVVGERSVLVASTAIRPASGQPVGSVVPQSDLGVQIATSDGDLLITSATTSAGDELSLDELGRLVGDHLAAPDARLADALAAADAELARHETFWSTRLARFERTLPTHLSPEPDGDWSEVSVPVPQGATSGELAAAVLMWWARTSNQPTVWFEYADDVTRQAVVDLRPFVCPPLGVFYIDDHATVGAVHTAVDGELRELGRRGPYLCDLVARDPATRHRSIDPALRIQIGDQAGSGVLPTWSCFDAVVASDGGDLLVRARIRDASSRLARAAEEIGALLRAGRVAANAPVRHLDVLGPIERDRLDGWNRTELAYDRLATVDGQFRNQVRRTPDAPAVSCAAATMSYAEMEQAVDRFAARLRESGATRASLVGIALDRDIDLLVAVLAVLSIGAAYVPLDPGYPEDRLQYMVLDSGLRVLVAGAETASRIAAPGLEVLTPDLFQTSSTPAPAAEHEADDLAYVIYTSGSTGRPKGVMLEHRNVVNFFAAMDQVIDHDPPGTWLAVTSLSFDISVLELLWTVTRGFHVVIQKHGITAPSPAHSTCDTRVASSRPTSLSLFFFAAGEEQASDGYRLLRESARYADEHGFEAIWLPERHFHAFGGAYPNPSVLASAVAVITTNVSIRAGSVVLPLHPSARVAEEWAVVDNLSNGRVGISFAPGWQPNDFVLNPSGYRTAKDDLQMRIDEVRALWRGETIDMVGPDDAMVSIATLPRPVQPELPVWLTSAGTTKTFERAGEMGVNLLTHLLGQSPEQLADNISVYRAAWQAAGHPGDGHITVMLHTFLCDDSAEARRRAEAPMKRYLGTATGLLKGMASAFPTFANAGVSADEAFRSLSDAEMEELLTIAAARYLDTSGLFGNADDAKEMVASLSRMGVDEVACLIDFGVETDDVLDSLPHLGELNDWLGSSGRAVPDESIADTDESLAHLVDRHGVTHLQCTPSLAAMLMADPGDRLALGHLRHLMVGGEALPEKLCVELRDAVAGRFTNMYGPTETTIWSLVHEIDHTHVGPVPIGTAIANTSLYILDPAGQRLPIGALGELHIGGDGVARGYLGREDLTSQRFVDRPGMGRLYATGDLARIHDDGVVEFAGRVDFQVKIRGHRIELGEIEAHLDAHPSVERSVVVARGDAADARLAAFVVPTGGADVDEVLLRKYVASALPDVMVPDFVVSIAALPLTPNGKVDRAALPQDIERDRAITPLFDSAVPKDDRERLVADVWIEQLGRPVGRHDNFFDIGGHSLLAVAVFRRLQQMTSMKIALTDVFRYPTVAGFAAYLNQLGGTAPSEAGEAERVVVAGADRGAMRRRVLDRRRSDGRGPDEKDSDR